MRRRPGTHPRRLPARGVGALPVKVHGQQDPRALRHGRSGSLGVHVERDRVNINEDRPRPQTPYGGSRGKESEGGYNDFVPFADLQGHQRQQQSVRAAGTADRVGRTSIFREVLLESLDSRPQHKLLPAAQAQNGTLHFIAHACVLPAQIKEGNSHRKRILPGHSGGGGEYRTSCRAKQGPAENLPSRQAMRM